MVRHDGEDYVLTGAPLGRNVKRQALLMFVTASGASWIRTNELRDYFLGSTSRAAVFKD